MTPKPFEEFSAIDQEDESNDAESSRIYFWFLLIIIAIGTLVAVFIYLFITRERVVEIPPDTRDLFSESDFTGVKLGAISSGFLALPRSMPERDRDISGINRGIFASGILTKPLAGNLQGLERGLRAGLNLGEAEIRVDSPKFLAAYVLEDVINILQIDVQELISNTDDRGRALNEHIFVLESLNSTARKTYQNIVVNADRLESSWEENVERAEEEEEEFFNEYTDFNINIAQNTYNEFLARQKLAVEQRAELGVLLSLQEQFEFYVPQLQDRLTLIRNNKEAIICGLEIEEVEE